MPIAPITLSSEANPRLLAAQFRIKHRDIFNMQQLYNLMHEWVKENQWMDTQDDFEGDAHESFYYDKTDLYGNKEIWIWWRLWQFSDGESVDTSNSFYRWRMDIDIHAVHMKETEIMHQGKKLKTDSGEVEIKIWAWIEMDYKGEWSKHPILKFFLDVFNLRIFESELDKHKHELYRVAFNFQNYIKKYLRLRTWLPQYDRQEFHPSQGTPEGAY